MLITHDICYSSNKAENKMRDDYQPEPVPIPTDWMTLSESDWQKQDARIWIQTNNHNVEVL